MTRGLYGWLYRTLTDCIPFRTLLDSEAGLRRMDRAELARYQVIVTFGRLVRGPVPGYEHIPMERQSVKFSIWVRPEVPEPGDLVLEDIQDRLMRALVWRQPANPIPGQDCIGADPSIVIMDAEHMDGDSEPEFDDAMQAWTKTINLRFLVMLATCQESQEWCGNCDDEPVEASAPSVFQGTAFNPVTQGNEATVGDFDIYVCNPEINEAALEANAPSDSLKLFYTICSLMPRYSGVYFDGQRAVTTEADYWHSGFPATVANRIAKDADNWHVRPSASLGTRVAAYILGATSLYFDGAMADECFGAIQNSWWDAYKLVDPLDNGGVALVDADRAYWDGQWDLMIDAFLSAMKAGFGTSRALIANSAGAVYAGIDGITIEEGHVALQGQAWAIARFEEQRLQWLASSNKYGTEVLNIVWNYSLTAAAPVYLGTDIL